MKGKRIKNKGDNRIHYLNKRKKKRMEKNKRKNRRWKRGREGKEYSYQIRNVRQGKGRKKIKRKGGGRREERGEL